MTLSAAVRPAAPTSLRRVAVTLLAAAVALVGLGFVLRGLDVAAVTAAIAGADPLLVLAAAVAVQVASVAKALRWRALLFPAPGGVGVLTALIYVGQFANNLLPTRAGDLARVELLHRATRVDRAVVLGGIAAEKLIDLVVLGALAGLMLLLVPVPGLFDGARPILLAALAGAGLVGLLLGLAPGVLGRRSDGVAVLLGRFAAGMSALRTAQGLGAVLTWTAVAWFAGLLGNVWTLAALNVATPWRPALVLLVALYAGLPVPALPGRLGLHQALCLAALAPFALGDAVALSAALIVYAQSILLPSLVGAGAAYWVGRRLAR